MGSPRSPFTETSPSSIPIPGPGGWMDSTGLNAVAGPSSEGALPSRSRGNTPSPPKSPSSAPPTPSVIASTHPSQFIHTHHPRRGSLTPLGLNLISPVAPHVARDAGQMSASRSVGFHQPWTNSDNNTALPNGGVSLGHRRGSAASTTSTLTQSRPLPSHQSNHSFYPPDWNPGRRRSSLNPALPSLAAPSPTRTHASGKSSRPVSSDGSGSGGSGMPSSRSRARVSGAEQVAPDSSAAAPISGVPPEVYARRGSLPHPGYGGWAGPAHRTWNPVLPPPRGSVGDSIADEAQLPDEGFKFGSVNANSGTSAASAALRAVEASPTGTRRPSIRKRDDMDVFEIAEEAEADRQRRAFLAATYGEDGKRARERLSIGGQSGQGPPGTPASALRRQSLLLWERMGISKSPGSGDEVGPSSAPPLPSALSHISPTGAFSEGDFAQRRGSLPIAIPGGGFRRSSSRRSTRGMKKGSPSRTVHPDIETSPAEEETSDESMDEDEDEYDGERHGQQNLSAPLRPLPPLLPLSDPGPRLLPSTLALHRANHLLQSRNLQSDPLPHPLPPSLHPPAPVDVTEFDIDFILAGSQTQLGGQGKQKNAHIDILNSANSSLQPQTPTLRLGGDEEDTFAKFVGAFDDEYGDRRGEWTFRACALNNTVPLSPRDPLDVSMGPGPKAEWESSGAGKYELFSNGEVRSAVTGRSWRVYKLGSREYELEEVKNAYNSSKTVLTHTGPHFGGERYTLAGKIVHRDQGGVKLPHFNTSNWLQPQHQEHQSSSGSARSASTVHTSDSHSDNSQLERKERLNSQASTVTMTPALSHGMPLSAAMAALAGNKKKQSIAEEEHHRTSFSGKEDKPKGKGLMRIKSKEAETEGKKDKSLGGVFKRALKSSGLGGSSSSDEKKAQREERERERAQAHSWSGASNVTHTNWFSGSSRGSDGLPYKAQAHVQPSDRERAMIRSHQSASSHHSATSSSDSGGPWSSGEQPKKAASSTTSGEDIIMAEPTVTAPKCREGKAWNGVPDEAVAMIIPLDEIPLARPSLPTRQPSTHPFFLEGSKQVLLVWYVPFNAEPDDTENRPSTASSKTSISDLPPQPFLTSGTATPGSLPKLQKLLRRRASKDNGVIKRETISQSLGNIHSPIKPQAIGRQSTQQSVSGSFLPPLPFRSFRVVAKVVDVQELKSESESVFDSGMDSESTNASSDARDLKVTHSTNSPVPEGNTSNQDEDEISPFNDYKKTVQVSKTGKSMPTVIAVCHSRSQGVEFVLEGLDRLGLCKGESAWGPTGYEEWRGTGLSEKGREFLDILWAGCTGVMGLSAL
ncbi:uncharacterized protein IL334_004195 [Kwoniella shivajii]|uniref:Rhodanese domain-containing protein n=1 Tax=Kwoniella shivajii TaxID=564305 RepID=A0ABZ1D113_9TREE|nr:hypothetical protein IL334_004195 [Kwoniella shivajii]